jgi:uncharacterized protein (TIGR03083 family)
MADVSRLGPKIDARPLFERDRAVLLQLLRDLRPDDWSRPTPAAPWTVQDVVAHLLGDDVSRLSRSRDRHAGSGPEPGQSLGVFLDGFNQQWVDAASRISPRVLLSLLEITTAENLEFWRNADLDAIGEPVSWAGPGSAPVWLDCARDFTEYWVHQQQIREATGRTTHGDPPTLRAVIDTFLRAVPHTLEQAQVTSDTAGSLSVIVPSPGAGTWTWRLTAGSWRWAPPSEDVATTVAMDAGTLWRLCVRMIEPAEALDRSVVRGDQQLAHAVLQIVAIVRS